MICNFYLVQLYIKSELSISYGLSTTDCVMKAPKWCYSKFFVGSSLYFPIYLQVIFCNAICEEYLYWINNNYACLLVVSIFLLFIVKFPCSPFSTPWCFYFLFGDFKFTYVSIDDVTEAYNLIKDLEPTTPSEYILKGTVTASLGQEQNSVYT